MQTSEIPVIEGLPWFNLETRLKNYALWLERDGLKLYAGIARVGIGALDTGQGIIFFETPYRHYRSVDNLLSGTTCFEFYKYIEPAGIFKPDALIAKVSGMVAMQVYPLLAPFGEIQTLRMFIAPPPEIIQVIKADIEST